MHFKLIRRLGAMTLSLLHSLGSFVLFVKDVLQFLFTEWPARDLLFKEMYRIGVLSVPVVLITGAFTGMVLTVQSYAHLHPFTLDMLISPIVGLSMTRELGPVLTGLMIAGRVGAAVAAELGTMRVTEQIDALVSLATNPIRYLVIPRVLACVLLLPCLTIFAIFIGIFAAYAFGVHWLGVPEIFFVKNLQNFVKFSDVASGLIKSIVFGGIVSLVSCYKGLYTEKGAEGVGLAVMEAVVISSIVILVSDFFLSIILF